ncbi:BON domain-containing protein [Acuticoccus sp. M5D2P5]|uniref:BON domain-containing protein n=1 Tax=Acuticoccus kalidii TaxID=2910977 RepID=UPI001F488BE1|nr:BON domain-containing protein [Acuticoccus kalidii]MCF3934876.1 BON domain-containing protein [Acuticoccus kalidii]
MDDITLRQEVLDELEFEPGLDADHIGVAVDKGIVTLSGHTSSYHEKILAEETVQRVKGVRGIAEEIEVRYPFEKKTADDQIAKRAVDVLTWDVRVPHDRVKIKVEDGWVTLSGEVNWNFQRQAAVDTVRRLGGVVGINNRMTVKPRVSATDVKKKIEESMKRSAEMEANGIRVSVTDGCVTLDGHVKAWYERRLAEKAAWSAPGVAAVEDRIKIG